MITLLVTLSFSQDDPPAQIQEKSEIAVLDMESQTISENVLSGIANRIRTELVKTGKFKIMRKNEMQKIFEKKFYQQTSCSDPDCAMRTGAVLEVLYVIIGTLTKEEETFTLEIKMIETESGAINKSETEACVDCDIDKVMIETTKSVAFKLAGVDPEEMYKKTEIQESELIEPDEPKRELTEWEVHGMTKRQWKRFKNSGLTPSEWKSREAERFLVKHRFEGAFYYTINHPHSSDPVIGTVRLFSGDLGYYFENHLLILTGTYSNTDVWGMGGGLQYFYTFGNEYLSFQPGVGAGVWKLPMAISRTNEELSTEGRLQFGGPSFRFLVGPQFIKFGTKADILIFGENPFKFRIHAGLILSNK
jgi:TolB-like protein